MAAQPLAALDAAPCDARLDAAGAAGASAAPVIVGLIGVQLVGTPARPAASFPDRRHGVEQRFQHRAIVPVGPA
jgi:hypothetical protein